MSTQKRLFACAAVLFGGLCSAFALVGVQPVLTNAVWSGGQFQFTLHGETNVAYILESSPDLRTWTPALTNSESHATRTVIVPAISSQTFWRVRPVPSALFEHAIVATGSVALSGSGRIDSFNSTNVAESTGAQYDPAKATDRAVVATTWGVTNALSVGNISIYGSVRTGSGGTVSLAPSGNVGSAAYNDNPVNDGTIEPGHFRDDFRAVLPAAFVPTNFGPAFPIGSALVPPTTGGTNYKYAILTDGDYMMNSSISIGAGEKMIINAKARLLVLGSTTVTSTGYILLGPDASIEWYARVSISIGGQGVINQTRSAANFSLIMLTSGPVNYSGQAGLIGTIYAPLSSVTLVGTTDAIGAIVCNSCTLSGSMSFHFDESLKSAGPFY